MKKSTIIILVGSILTVKVLFDFYQKNQNELKKYDIWTFSNFIVFYCFVTSISKKVGIEFFSQINQLIKTILYQIYLKFLHTFLTILQKFGGKYLKNLFIFFFDFFYFKVYCFFFTFEIFFRR